MKKKERKGLTYKGFFFILILSLLVTLTESHADASNYMCDQNEGWVRNRAEQKVCECEKERERVIER